ncbi:MAG: type II toxin-antitoxin system Phd/YefM family antitoxin [Geovibrio sp.]|nr:type II toxin-antitoxin system Phd/YefM family antitoxin [Geovibrio thiophilus]MCD8492567.1 type II toxin-antitoxin system Phd/YefM family antitoxin [Geovibrio sp.]MCD8567641.1 type II toxin-antitoxin system Phd/YefM family antitoxin [Geovibrio sp.]
MYGVKYELNEMMSASSFSRNMNKVADLLRDKNRVVVLRNNNPEMIVLPVQEYELMKSVMDLAEHVEIAQLIEERKNSEKVPLDEALKRLGLEDE